MTDKPSLNVVEELLLDGLLQQHYEATSTTEARLACALARLPELEKKQTSHINPLGQLFWRLSDKYWHAIAAGFTLVCTSLLFTGLLTATPTASAEVHRLVNQLAKLGDRLYQIQVDFNRQSVTAKQARKTFSGGLLYLREHNQFLLVQQQTNNRQTLKALNLQESWVLKPNGESSRHPLGQIKIPIAGDGQELLFTDLHTTLASLEDNYSIKLFTEQFLLGSDSELWLVAAKKNNRASKGPKRVSVYYHPDSHLIEAVVFDGIHLQGNKSPKRLTMSLIAREPLDAQWFELEFQQQLAEQQKAPYE